jgi:hypothetical protein
MPEKASEPPHCRATHVMKSISIDHESKLLGAASCYAGFQSFAVAHALYLTEPGAEGK